MLNHHPSTCWDDSGNKNGLPPSNCPDFLVPGADRVLRGTGHKKRVWDGCGVFQFFLAQLTLRAFDSGVCSHCAKELTLNCQSLRREGKARATGAGRLDIWVLGGEGAWYPEEVLGAGKSRILESLPSDAGALKEARHAGREWGGVSC